MSLPDQNNVPKQPATQGEEQGAGSDPTDALTQEMFDAVVNILNDSEGSRNRAFTITQVGPVITVTCIENLP